MHYQNYYQLLHSTTAQFIDGIFTGYNIKINDHLSNWRGVKKNKQDLNSFEQYFKIARNTFDQRKIQIMVSYLWTPIIQKISEVFLLLMICYILSEININQK